MRILFKLATRSRPQKFFNCLENIIEQAVDNFLILVSYDEDDETMTRERIGFAMDNLLNRIDPQREKIIMCCGTSKNKIDAINRDFDKVKEWDILINTSDDMTFVKKGFDNDIRADFALFPDLDGFLHYNDGNQRDRVATMSIMGRKYYDRFGYVYHPSYQSLFSDEEATEVAKRLGKYKYMGDEKILFNHNHPAWGLGEYDEQYRRTEARAVWIADENNFHERKAKNFET